MNDTPKKKNNVVTLFTKGSKPHGKLKERLISRSKEQRLDSIKQQIVASVLELEALAGQNEAIEFLAGVLAKYQRGGK